MSVSSGILLLSLALIMIVGLYIIEPFMRPRAKRTYQPGQRTKLQSHKEALLSEIQHLEFDLQTGVLSQEDFDRQRRDLLVQAAHVAKQLDNLSASAADSIDDRIENAVARQRLKSASRQKAVAPAQTVAVATPGEGGSTPLATQFCPQCGQATRQDDRFCRNCGHNLNA